MSPNTASIRRRTLRPTPSLVPAVVRGLVLAALAAAVYLPVMFYFEDALAAFVITLILTVSVAPAMIGGRDHRPA